MRDECILQGAIQYSGEYPDKLWRNGPCDCPCDGHMQQVAQQVEDDGRQVFKNYFLTFSIIPESFHRIAIWFQAVEWGAFRGSLRLIGWGDEPVSLSSWWDGDIQAHTDYQPLLQVLPHCPAQTGSEPADGGVFFCLFFCTLTQSSVWHNIQNRSHLKLIFWGFLCLYWIGQCSKWWREGNMISKGPRARKQTQVVQYCI